MPRITDLKFHYADLHALFKYFHYLVILSRLGFFYDNRGFCE